MRLIDADALMRKLEPIVEAENQIYRRESWGFAVKCRNEVEEAPTIEPNAQPQRPMGKWIWKLDEGDPGRSMMLVCSICGSGRNEVGTYNFCHICGKKMINPKGEQNER